MVPDASGDRPIFKDAGPHLGAFRQLPAPGPLWHASHTAFNGRPAWECDRIITTTDKFFDNFHTLLSPQLDKTDKAQWFGWPQPWWGAILMAPRPGTDGGKENTALDGDPGMTTIELEPTVNISTWPANWVTGPYIRSTLSPIPGRSMLIVWQANGDNSWLETTHKAQNGSIVTNRVLGAQANRLPLNTFHSGWSNENLTSCIGLAKGVAADPQVAGVRSWVAPFLNNA
jgi:hypothetical protein